MKATASWDHTIVLDLFDLLCSVSFCQYLESVADEDQGEDVSPHIVASPKLQRPAICTAR